MSRTNRIFHQFLADLCINFKRFFMNFHVFFGVVFRIDFLLIFFMEMDPKMGPDLIAGTPFWRPLSGIDFGRHFLLPFGFLFAPFWSLWAPFRHLWTPFRALLAPFSSLLANFWLPFALFGFLFFFLWLSFGVFLKASARFQDFCIVFYWFPVILQEFIMIFFP